jgi:D-proline reductase (dithiol) PrdB
VEAIGIPTMTIGSMKAPLLRVKPPGSVVTKFPRGATLGAPGDRATQGLVLLDAFAALQTMTEPGSLLELPYAWKEPS